MRARQRQTARGMRTLRPEWLQVGLVHMIKTKTARPRPRRTFRTFACKEWTRYVRGR
jgi:hypothetical protein